MHDIIMYYVPIYRNRSAISRIWNKNRYARVCHLNDRVHMMIQNSILQAVSSLKRQSRKPDVYITLIIIFTCVQ